MTSALLNWQRRQRRRESGTPLPAFESPNLFWELFVEGTRLLAKYDEAQALKILLRADSCCPPLPAIRAALDETLGEAEFLLNDYGRALEHLRRAQSAWLELEEPLLEAEVRSWVGSCLVQLGRYQDGFEALTSAIASFETLNARPRSARALFSLAVIHEELGDLNRAFEVYREALECAQADGDADMEGRVLVNHGKALGHAGEHEQALPILGKAVDILRGVGAHGHSSWCLLAIGRLHADRGQDELALDFHRLALEAVEMGHSPRARVEVFAGLGTLHSQLGNHDEAHQWLNKALGLATGLGVRREIYQTYLLLSEAHKRARHFEAALNAFEQFHKVRAEVFDELARERVAALKSEFELQRVIEARERERETTVELAVAYAKLEQRAEKLTHLSLRDGLTGLFNRRHFEEALSLELQRAKRFGQSMCLGLVDIDHFKRINDGFSHVVGDAVLRAIAQVLLRELRASDVAARYGGEEFVLILPNTSLDGARIAAEKVRVAIATSPWTQLTPGQVVTASLGLVEWKSGEPALELVRRADQALYAAKSGGRNRVRAG